MRRREQLLRCSDVCIADNTHVRVPSLRTAPQNSHAPVIESSRPLSGAPQFGQCDDEIAFPASLFTPHRRESSSTMRDSVVRSVFRGFGIVRHHGKHRARPAHFHQHPVPLSSSETMPSVSTDPTAHSPKYSRAASRAVLNRSHTTHRIPPVRFSAAASRPRCARPRIAART